MQSLWQERGPSSKHHDAMKLDFISRLEQDIEHRCDETFSAHGKAKQKHQFQGRTSRIRVALPLFIGAAIFRFQWLPALRSLLLFLSGCSLQNNWCGTPSAQRNKNHLYKIRPRVKTCTRLTAPCWRQIIFEVLRLRANTTLEFPHKLCFVYNPAGLREQA